TVAGNGTIGFAGDGGLATAAEFNSPEGVAVDASGNLYIGDVDNQRIRAVNLSTGIITTIAGNGTSGFSGDGGLATAAELAGPFGVAVDASGNVFIADAPNDRVRELVPPSSQRVSTTSLASSASTTAFAGSVIFTATVTGSGGIPTGTVTF